MVSKVWCYKEGNMISRAESEERLHRWAGNIWKRRSGNIHFREGLAKSSGRHGRKGPVTGGFLLHGEHGSWVWFLVKGYFVHLTGSTKEFGWHNRSGLRLRLLERKDGNFDTSCTRGTNVNPFTGNGRNWWLMEEHVWWISAFCSQFFSLAFSSISSSSLRLDPLLVIFLLILLLTPNTYAYCLFTSIVIFYFIFAFIFLPCFESIAADFTFAYRHTDTRSVSAFRSAFSSAFQGKKIEEIKNQGRDVWWAGRVGLSQKLDERKEEK